MIRAEAGELARTHRPRSVLVELGIVAALAGQLFDRRLAQLGLKLVQFGLLTVVATHGPITPTDLGMETGLLENYCNGRVTTLLEKTAVTLDEGTRTKLLNQAETIMANDVPSIPMFVRPVFAISSKKVKGLTAPTTLEGSTWDANAWGVQ